MESNRRYIKHNEEGKITKEMLKREQDKQRMERLRRRQGLPSDHDRSSSDESQGERERSDNSDFNSCVDSEDPMEVYFKSRGKSDRSPRKVSQKYHGPQYIESEADTLSLELPSSVSHGVESELNGLGSLPTSVVTDDTHPDRRYLENDLDERREPYIAVRPKVMHSPKVHLQVRRDLENLDGNSGSTAILGESRRRPPTAASLQQTIKTMRKNMSSQLRKMSKEDPGKVKEPSVQAQAVSKSPPMAKGGVIGLAKERGSDKENVTPHDEAIEIEQDLQGIRLELDKITAENLMLQDRRKEIVERRKSETSVLLQKQKKLQQALLEKDDIYQRQVEEIKLQQKEVDHMISGTRLEARKIIKDSASRKKEKKNPSLCAGYGLDQTDTERESRVVDHSQCGTPTRPSRSLTSLKGVSRKEALMGKFMVTSSSKEKGSSDDSSTHSVDSSRVGSMKLPKRVPIPTRVVDLSNQGTPTRPSRSPRIEQLKNDPLVRLGSSISGIAIPRSKLVNVPRSIISGSPIRPSNSMVMAGAVGDNVLNRSQESKKHLPVGKSRHRRRHQQVGSGYASSDEEADLAPEMTAGGDSKKEMEKKKNYKPRFGETFSDGDLRSYERFKRKFQTTATLHHWDNDICCMELWNAVKGKAADRLNMLAWQDVDDISILWRTLDKAYIPKNYQRALKDEFRSCRKKTSETMKHYCINLQQLYLQGHTEATPKEVAENVRDQMLSQISESEMDYCFPFISKEDPEDIADEFDAVFTEMKRFNKGHRRDADLALESISRETSKEVETQVTPEVARSEVVNATVLAAPSVTTLNPQAPVFHLQSMAAIPATATPAPAQFGQSPVPLNFSAPVTGNMQSVPQPYTSYPQPTGNAPSAPQAQPQGQGSNPNPGQGYSNARRNGNQGQRNYNNRNNGGNHRAPKDYSNVQCWNCNGYGHLRRNCPDLPQQDANNQSKPRPPTKSQDTAQMLDHLAKKMMAETAARLENQNIENTLRLEGRIQEIMTNSLKATGLVPKTGTGNQTKK